MRIYNGIFCCERDNHHVSEHIASLKELAVPMVHCLYYGMGQKVVEDVPHHVVGVHELYENLPMKTYCMLEHALRTADWDRFLKTDVNSKVLSVDWQMVEEHDLVGYLALQPGCRAGKEEHPRLWARILPPNKISQPALVEPYLGHLSEWWVGGPAYVLSRRLAQRIVDRGIWAARAYAAEDMMVCSVAMQNGIRPVAGVGYFTDGMEQVNER